MDSISISYCGGCNEAFDRVALARALLQKMEALVGQTPRQVGAEEAADMHLLICGCMSMCIAYKQKESNARLCHIIGPGYLNFIKTTPAKIVEKVAREFARLQCPTKQETYAPDASFPPVRAA